MTLLEVMLALVMLLGSVMALSRLAFLARRHSVSSEDQTQAQLLCQGVMQELLAGIQPLDPVSEQTFDEYPQWIYSIDVQPLGSAPLLAVSVRVVRLPEEQPESLALADPDEDELDGYRLVRWIRTHGRYEQPESTEQQTAVPAGPGPVAAPRPWTWTPKPSAPTAFEGDAFTAPDDR
jgi:hypothetical protein